VTTAASPDVSGVTTRLPGANVVWITQATGFAQRSRPKVLLPIVPVVVALPAIYEPPEFLAEPTELYAPALEIPAQRLDSGSDSLTEPAASSPPAASPPAASPPAPAASPPALPEAPAIEEDAPPSDSVEADAASPEAATPANGDEDAPPAATEQDAQAVAQPKPQPPDSREWRGIVLVTGTDTSVGKTVVTAAIAAAAQASGLRVAVIKPGQTGTPSDIEVITRLASPDTTRTLASYPERMAPLAAATVSSMKPLELYEVVDAIRAEATKHDLVLVEGTGGLLIPMGVRPSGESWTVADLATTLGASTIVVARAGQGTLNHTALTLEALARRGVPAGVVIGAWPAEPDLEHWANLSELVPHLVGALPEGAGRMDPGVFRRSAPGWLTPPLYGVLDNWRVWAEETGEGHH
jgi:dethiobiotin synthetase